MSSTNKLSRNAVANGGFGDPDLTPKPLRISKREHARTSTAGTINSLFPIQKSQTQGDLQAVAPSDKSTSWINNTPLDLSLQDLAAPTSQWARRNTFLHVHKQRQSEPINTKPGSLTKTLKETNEPIGHSSVASPARSRKSCPTMSQLGNSSDTGTAVSTNRPISIRAFTIGTFGKHNPLSPVHELSSPTSASPAPRTRHRRAVTNAEASYKDQNRFETSPHQITQRSSSAKNSLISRVMSGLTNRTHNSHAASWGGHEAVQTPPEHSSATQSRIPEHKHVFKRSDSSIETDTSSDRNPQNAQAAYPTLPTSRATSSTTARSVDSHQPAMPQRFRELCQPADAVVMGAELTLTPEYDELRSGKEQSMWVSLDIRGTANSPTRIQDVWSQHTGLDIVVIIDNSLHTSPAALMASCETARFLASIMNSMTDQFAILCTSDPDAGGEQSYSARWEHFDVDEVKEHLDVITCSKERIKPDDWIETIDCAKEMLLRCAMTDSEEDLLQDNFGHIFILTPDTNGLPCQSLAHDDLTFHIICPASVPRNDQARIHCNGWKLRSLSGNGTQVVSKRKDLDPMSVTNRLRALIAQARSGKRLGNLTDLVLEVSAGPDCVVEGVLGNVSFTEMNPGEVFTVLFRLTVRGARVQDYASSGNSASSSETLLNTNDVLGQLDKMIGTRETKALTARVTYKHSLLPAGTTCCVTTDCHITRSPPDPDQEPTISHSKYLLARDCTVKVDQRLAYHLAVHRSPRNALQTLRNEFGDSFQYSACQEYIHLLATELKHQARILERLELNASPLKARKPPTSPPPPATPSFSRKPATHSNGHENDQPGSKHQPSDMSTAEPKKTPTTPSTPNYSSWREPKKTPTIPPTANYSLWRPTTYLDDNDDDDQNRQPTLHHNPSDISTASPKKPPTSPPISNRSFWHPTTHGDNNGTPQPAPHHKTNNTSTPSPKKPGAPPTISPPISNSSHWRPPAYENRNGTPPPNLHRKTSDMSVEELFGTEPALSAPPPPPPPPVPPLPTTIFSPTPTTKKAAVLAVKQSREKLKTDEARRIWGDLRRMRKGDGGADRDERKGMDDGKAEEVRKVALRNKRSVGTETLRSIFSVGEGMGRGMGAPWM